MAVPVARPRVAAKEAAEAKVSRSARKAQAKARRAIGPGLFLLVLVLVVGIAAPHPAESHLSGGDRAVVGLWGAPADAGAVLAAGCHAGTTCLVALAAGLSAEAGGTAQEHAAVGVPDLALDTLPAGPFRPPRGPSLV